MRRGLIVLGFGALIVLAFVGAGCANKKTNSYPGNEPYVSPTSPPPGYDRPTK